MQTDFSIPDPIPGQSVDNRYFREFPETWILLQDYTRAWTMPDGIGYEMTVPAGFRWDSASIPKRFQDRIARWGRHSYASLIHDWLYDQRIGTRERADEIFYVLLLEDGVGKFKSWIMYKAVRLGGRRAWLDDK